jgi:hypothetical protein
LFAAQNRRRAAAVPRPSGAPRNHRARTSLRLLNDVAAGRIELPELSYPDGLSPDHARRHDWRAWASEWGSLLVLGGLMAAAMSGVLGGGRAERHAADLPRATLAATLPTRVRNGEMLEMRIEVAARADIADATIAVPPSLWRDITINTQIPAAGEEAFEDGAFRFRYGPLKAGERLAVKIDGQINPPLTRGTAGEIALYDGDTRIGAVPVAITVLP